MHIENRPKSFYKKYYEIEKKSVRLKILLYFLPTCT